MPDSGGKPPVAIMAHGFAGQKDFGLQPYAEHFASSLQVLSQNGRISTKDYTLD
jgi:fermentation-respiration switch protein FrsA (DUF1100 family)